MIDLNNQILSLPYEEAEQEITRLIRIGYRGLILTSPALVDKAFELDEIITRFNRLKVSFKQIQLFLGSEIHYHYLMIHRLEQKEVLPLAQSDYIFVKLPPNKKPEQLLQLISYLKDKKIILSCIEEYKYFSLGDLVDLKEKGVLYFSNINNLKMAKLRKLLKKKLIDFLGSYCDTNDYRENKFIKKLDNQYYKKITRDNYYQIIQIDL